MTILIGILMGIIPYGVWQALDEELSDARVMAALLLMVIFGYSMGIIVENL